MILQLELGSRAKLIIILILSMKHVNKFQINILKDEQQFG